VVTDHSENDLPGKRLPGCRVKHRAKFNWIKMYDKGSVLRVETVINQPEEFRVRRRVRRNGKWTNVWGPMRKGIAFLFRYQQVSAQSNARYLDALPASTIRSRPSASLTPSLAPLSLRTAGRRGPSIRSPARTARSSPLCSLVSTLCTASPTATSERSSGELRSLSPASPKSNPARSLGSSAGYTPTISSLKSLARAAGASLSADAG